MMARSPTRSNQRPDTLTQDRICQVDQTSCNARPDKLTTPDIDFHQKQLAAYLARARGPLSLTVPLSIRLRADEVIE